MVLGYHILMIIFLFLTGPLGILFNATFIWCTLMKKELQKEYAWFLCGISMVDLIYCINNAVPQVIAIFLNVNPKGTYCQVVGVILLINGVGAVCIQPLLAMNRFISLYYSHLQTKYFSRRNNLLMLISTYLFCILVAAILFYLDDMGRMGNTICGPEIENMPISHICLFAAPMFLSYGICIFCGYKILYLIKSHQAEARRQQLGSRLAHAKDIFHLIILELVVPISLEMPVLVASIVSSQIYIPPFVIAATCSLFVMHPVMDPVIVVVVMRPYRNFVRKIWRALKGVTDIHPTITTNNISTIPVTNCWKVAFCSLPIYV